MKQKPSAAFPLDHARRFTGSTRNGIVGWQIRPMPGDEAIQITLDAVVRKKHQSFSVTVDAQDAFAFREAIGHAYDLVYGL